MTNEIPPNSRRTSSEPTNESCGICGGDRRIANSFGLTTTCPSCHGTGRRMESSGFHDVTKTKASHYRQSNKAEVVEKAQWPVTFEGAQLATEIRDSPACQSALKVKLIREIMDHESTHGQCTQTFLKKVRKQIRPRA